MRWEWLIGLNCIATWVMVGVIWMVHWVHYPLLGYGLTDESAATLHTLHQLAQVHAQRIGWIVLPMMMLEAVSTGLLWLVAVDGLKLPGVVSLGPWGAGLLWLGAVLLAGIWGSTFLVQVPLHQQLKTASSVALWHQVHHQLVYSNGLRTLLWTLRGLIVTLLAGLLVYGKPSITSPL